MRAGNKVENHKHDEQQGTLFGRCACAILHVLLGGLRDRGTGVASVGAASLVVVTIKSHQFTGFGPVNLFTNLCKLH